MAEIEIFTDGAASGNPGPGGLGVIMRSGRHVKEFSAGFRYTTNNRMELLSVILALESLKNPGNTVHIYCDSKYVVDAIEKNWIGGWVRKNWKNVKNPDLWKRYLSVAVQNSVRFHWIRGHDGHPMNERCDEMAVAARLQENLPADEWYEKYGAQ